MPCPLPRPLKTVGPLLLLLPLLAATPSGEAAGAAACAAVARGTPAPSLQSIATCDECRTSGKRKGYKQCCELIGGDYRCEWVRC